MSQGQGCRQACDLRGEGAHPRTIKRHWRKTSIPGAAFGGTTLPTAREETSPACSDEPNGR